MQQQKNHHQPTTYIEADYLEDMKYEWGYALKHWTSNHYHYDKDSSKYNEGSFHEQASIKNSEYDKIGNNKKNFKCRFCK